nr:hypothetical protein [Tanacetum cinerariifolium]
MDGETKILAKVNGRQRTVSGSSIRRHLKLNDEEGKDRENVAKTSAMSHEASLKVTSLGGGEGRGSSKHKGMDQGEDLLVGDTVKDSDKSADKVSDITDDMANVVGTFVATPTTRVTRSSRRVVIESSSPISINIPSISKKDKEKGKMTEPEQPSKEMVLEQMSAQLARDLEAEFAQEDQIIREQAERHSEIARIHAERELMMMILGLDRSNKIVAMYLIWEKMQDFVPMNSKLESERLKRLGIQLGKERFNKLKTAKASGTEPTQEQQSEEPKELSEEELKKMIEDLDRLLSLVKETCSIIKVTNKKEKELWVELKRLYEPNSRDPLQALQRFMHDPLVWRLYDTCGVHHVSTERGYEIFMLVEKDYPLTKGLTTLMLCNKLQVDQYSEIENELLMKIYIIANSLR